MEYFHLIQTNDIAFEKICNHFNNIQSIKNSSWDVNKISPLYNFNILNNNNSNTNNDRGINNYNSHNNHNSHNQKINKYLLNLSNQLNDHLLVHLSSKSVQYKVYSKFIIINDNDNDNYNYNDNDNDNDNDNNNDNNNDNDNDNDNDNEKNINKIPSIAILVCLKDLKTNKSKISKVLLISTSNEPINNNLFIKYNMILSQGNKQIIKSIINWLSCSFDCYISDVVFSSIVVYQLLSKWIQNELQRSSSLIINKKRKINNINNNNNSGDDNNNNNSINNNNSNNSIEIFIPKKHLELIYSFESLLNSNQEEDKSLSTIKVTIPPESIKNIINIIENLNNISNNHEKKSILFSAICEHFQSLMNFPLESCALIQAGTSYALLGVSGKLKIYSNIKEILKDLSEYI